MQEDVFTNKKNMLSSITDIEYSLLCLHYTAHVCTCVCVQ